MNTRVKRASFLLTLCLALALAIPSYAHEGTIGVVDLRIADGSYTIAIPAEPLTTLNRLELANGEELTEDPSIAPRKLETRVAAIASAMTVEFQQQGRTIRASSTVTITPKSIRLAGRLPEGATHVSFQNALSSSDTVLVVTDGGSRSEVPVHGDEKSPAVALAAPRSPLVTFASYLRLGVLHIIPRGVDHILFVLGLFFLSPRIRSLLAQVSIFTLAHTLTLGLSMFGIVSINSAIVEPAIALSIVFVAVENLRRSEAGRTRLVVVAAFGLLHGLGFASALRETGLPVAQRTLALVAFNAGVEVAQLTIIAAALLVVAICRRWSPDAHRRLAVPASLIIAAIGAWWMIERLF